jgi:hypothetical protein
MSFLKRIRDLAVETLIAVILTAAFVTYLFMVPTENRPNGMWIPLVLNTAIVFGFLISWFRHAWKNAQYWTVLAVLLVCHSAVYIFVLPRIGHFPLVIYVVANSAELVLFSQILWKFPSHRQQPTNS